jgi:signal transduction histidine kinase
VLALISRLQIDRKRSVTIIASVGALVTIAIGAFGVIAWHSHSEWLWVMFPGMFYMKYNTALGFMAAGAGLLACVWRERTLTFAAAGLALVIGSITLTEYVAGVNLGFDELFLKDYWYPDNPLRGRMAPSAAVALASIGVMLILLAGEGKRTFPRVIAMEMLSFAVLAIGVTAMVGYLAEAGVAYSWGTTARVAKETAVGFVATGIGLVALTWQHQSERIARVPLWVPALLCFTVLAIDLSTPRGPTLGIGYIPIIFCSLWFTQPYMAFVFALITSGLTILGYFAQPPGPVDPWVIMINRALTIGALWSVATLVYLRRRTELKLQGYMDQLERSNQELDDFAYIASHDLKEPLRGLFNHASFLLEDYQNKLDEDGTRRLKRLSLLSQRMERLVNDLLYFSRLGRAELAIQETDLNGVIDEIRLMMEAMLTERHARVIVPRSLPRIVCDKPRVTEVFRNLITNAVKYNDKTKRTVEVGFREVVNTSDGPEWNVFYVKDNGIGIEAEFYDEIFRIFKRLNTTDRQEAGTGVGLTFVKKIVERHGGRVWLESEPGKGTTFYFNLNSERQEPARQSHERDIVQVPVPSHG